MSTVNYFQYLTLTSKAAGISADTMAVQEDSNSPTSL
jgi:hypothetical protein